MTDISFGITEDGRNVVYVGDDDIEVGDLSGLLAEARELSAADLATAVNHLAVGNEFSVITDVTAYALAVRARLEAEPAGQPWQEGVIRLRDHGVPDIKSLTVPSLSSDRLVYFAADRLLGAPYRVEVSLADGLPEEADYRALPLRPLPQTAAPNANPYWVGDNSPKPAGEPVEIVDVEEQE